MPPSSDSISSTSLPFGVDNHIHANLGRSGSLPRSVHHEYQSAVYDHDPQAYSTLVANAHASHAASRCSNAPIPPSSIHSIPSPHKKFLRQHRILFWVLIGVFNISLIALTTAIVLGAVTAHQHGQNGMKYAAIIVGVFGFSGIVGSTAAIWLILTGRRARARLEKRWDAEERVKEARDMRERRKESHIRESIRHRERSLSRSRSRGRDRERITRPAVAKKPSFRAMTPGPRPPSRRPEAEILWSRPLNVSVDIHNDFKGANDKKKNKEKNYEHDSTHDSDRKKGDDQGGHHGEGKTQVKQKMRDSASTQFQDLDPSNSENDGKGKAETNSQPITTNFNEEARSYASLQFDESRPQPPLPESDHTSPNPLNTNSTYIGSSSTDPYPLTIVPYNTAQLMPNHKTPITTAILRTNYSSIQNSLDDDAPAHIPRLNNGGLGSAQSDENFQAMLDLADDVGSEDEKDRQARRKAIKKGVEAWASTASLGAEEGGVREAEEAEGGCGEGATACGY